MENSDPEFKAPETNDEDKKQVQETENIQDSADKVQLPGPKVDNMLDENKLKYELCIEQKEKNKVEEKMIPEAQLEGSQDKPCEEKPNNNINEENMLPEAQLDVSKYEPCGEKPNTNIYEEKMLQEALSDGSQDKTCEEKPNNNIYEGKPLQEAQVDDHQDAALSQHASEKVHLHGPNLDLQQQNEKQVTNQLLSLENEYLQTDIQLTEGENKSVQDKKLKIVGREACGNDLENSQKINSLTNSKTKDEMVQPKEKVKDQIGEEKLKNEKMLDVFKEYDKEILKLEPVSSEEIGDESSVTPEKISESDTNSDDPSFNDEQNNLCSNGSNSQFYETGDSKVDYAVKIEDNDTLSDIEDIKTDTASADSEDSALGSLPPDNTDITDNTVVNDMSHKQQAQDASDGSDSGIGSEAPDKSQHSFNLSISSCSKNEEISEKSITDVPKKTDSNQKDNKSHDGGENSLNIENIKTESDDDDKPLAQFKRPLKSSIKRKIDEQSNDEPQTKKKKAGIQFDYVTVYYFPRAQGFSCVPSQGGSTLGMELEHSHIENFSLAEHAIEQRRIHRQVLQQLKNERHALEGIELSSSDDSDTEEEASDISESELDLDNYYFLQPVPTRQRRALLRAAGVKKIEPFEKTECRDIRTSREFCGCACKGVCKPETCLCSLAGIKCQVDRLNFPCGCTRDGCSNTTGRIEFNPVRVRTHFIQTLMRLVEKNREETKSANKRQWGMHNSVPCVSNAAYTQNQCPTFSAHEENIGPLLREVDHTPRVEACVNKGDFNNVHNMNSITGLQSHLQSNVNYTYGHQPVDQKILGNENHVMNYNVSNNHHGHAAAYSSNMLQGKGPPYATSKSMGYDATNAMQTFAADLNYSYEQQTDNHFKGVHSYSATSFEEFAHNHNSQMSMFSHYNHMYVPDYLHKPSTSMHNHSSLQYHAMPHVENNYEMYKGTSECVNVQNSESKTESQSNYATLMMPYQSSNKLQAVENDQNWFSQGRETAMEVDGADQVTSMPSIPHVETAPAQETSTETAPPNNAETTENFGELIKKTMVESVTV